MAWAIDSWTMSGGDSGVCVIEWKRTDSGIAGASKTGSFMHTMNPTATWLDAVADIEARIDAEEGMHS